MDEQRRRFEEWATSKGWGTEIWPRSRDKENGGYFDARTGGAWPGWQAAQPTKEPSWKCAARSANMGANDPQDCDWPLCNCDPYADKVIAALQECGISFVKAGQCEEIARKIAAGLRGAELEGLTYGWVLQTQLPASESLLGTVTRLFPEKARIAA